MRDLRLPAAWTRSLGARRALALVVSLAAALLTLALRPGASYAARAWTVPSAEHSPDRPAKPSVTDAHAVVLHAIVPAALHIEAARTDAGSRLVPFARGLASPVPHAPAIVPYAPVWSLAQPPSPSRAFSLLMLFLN